MKMTTERNSKIQVMHFLVKDVQMCAHLQNIKKVLSLMALESIPGAPPYVAGLMNFEGRSIPVIDLAIRTGLTRDTKYSINTPILLCQKDNKEAAFIVDNILELVDTDETKLEMHNEFNKPDSPYLASIIYQLEPSLLINMNYLLDIKLTEKGSQYAG